MTQYILLSVSTGILFSCFSVKLLVISNLWLLKVLYMPRCASVSAGRPVTGPGCSDPFQNTAPVNVARQSHVTLTEPDLLRPTRLSIPYLCSFRIYQFLISHNLWLTVHSPSLQREITFFSHFILYCQITAVHLVLTHEGQGHFNWLFSIYSKPCY